MSTLLTHAIIGSWAEAPFIHQKLSTARPPLHENLWPTYREHQGILSRVCSLWGSRLRLSALDHPWDVAQYVMTDNFSNRSVAFTSEIRHALLSLSLLRVNGGKTPRRRQFRFNVTTARPDREGKSCARFNGLRHGNPGMKTQSVQTGKLFVCVGGGGELCPLPPVEVLFCFFLERLGPAWHGAVAGSKKKTGCS